MHPMLQKLPVELLEAIIDHLPSKKDRRSLWAVSKIFLGLLASRVFETLTIRAKDHALLQLDSRPYDSLDATHPLECLKLIRHLHLKAPFREKLDIHIWPQRCPHHYELYGCPHLYPNPYQPNGATPRMLKLIPLLSQLQENGLVSFSWDLGMCIPGHILGREGYLPKKQTAIESLSLITTPCPDEYLQSLVIEPVVLSNFPQLRKFTWKGLCTTEQLNSLRDLFASNYEVLEDLELDFNDWDYVKINGRRPAGIGLEEYSLSSFQSHILPHKSNKDLEPFRSLKRLALSAFEFDKPAWGFTHSFNIPCLQVLKLYYCTGIVEFLSTILEAGLVLKLKSLELIIQDGGVERNGFRQSALIGFLESFQGLEDLYIMIELEESTPEYWASYWNAILHHSSTLKRLIYHQRKYVPWWSTELPEADFIDAGFAPPSNPGSEDEDPDDWNDFIYNRPLAQMQLECFGIADDVGTALVTMLDPLSAEKNFKLLHFRRTATDPSQLQRADDVRFEDQVRALVKHNPSSWSPDDYSDKMREGHSLFLAALEVFRSPKFDNLQILAFGDFSHKCRYKWASLLLCRAVTPNPEVNFRVMLPDDIASYKRSGVLNVDFLTACPRNGLFTRGTGGDYL